MPHEVEIIECPLCVAYWSKSTSLGPTYKDTVPAPGPGYSFPDDYNGELPGDKKIGKTCLFSLNSPAGTRIFALRCQIKGMLPWWEVPVRKIGETVRIWDKGPIHLDRKIIETTILGISLSDYHTEGPYKYELSHLDEWVTERRAQILSGPDNEQRAKILKRLDGPYYWTQLCLEMQIVD